MKRHHCQIQRKQTSINNRWQWQTQQRAREATWTGFSWCTLKHTQHVTSQWRHNGAAEQEEMHLYPRTLDNLVTTKTSCNRDVTAHAPRSLGHFYCFVSVVRPQQHKASHRKEEHHQVERFLKRHAVGSTGSKTRTHRHAAPHGAGGAEPPDQFDQCMKAKSLGLAHLVTRQVVFCSVWDIKEHEADFDQRCHC